MMVQVVLLRVTFFQKKYRSKYGKLLLDWIMCLKDKNALFVGASVGARKW